ncbi:hypothetical protein A2U01_0068296, partial [Trifolium medium]|nr:hypothetical protein [Trifolium medium]
TANRTTAATTNRTTVASKMAVESGRRRRLVVTDVLVGKEIKGTGCVYLSGL